MTALSGDRVLTWLAVMLVVNFALTAAFFLGVATTTGLTRDTATQALKATAPGQALRLERLGTVDSWRPMLQAYNRKLEDPRSDLYEVFFVDRVKFQYLPSSLLVFDLFPRSMTRIADDVIGRPLRQWLAWLSRIAVGLAALASAVILEVGLRRVSAGRPAPPARVAVSVGLSLALGLTFYPLLFGYDLGQIQVFLNALLALGILCSLLGRPVLAGACFGACCLVKPQYGLILVWSLLRRQWRFTLGLAAVLFSGLSLSIARFGLADHLRYLDVVREVALGEYYWTNQSVNGLLHRFLEHGNQLKPVTTEFAPYHPVVYALTVLSSVALIALALWPRRRDRAAEGGPVDLMVMLAATTMASPVAWIHHYGPFLPFFAAAVPGALSGRPVGRATIPLLVISYVAVANLLIWPAITFGNHWLGLTGSHVFYGGLIMFGLLLALRGAGPPGRT